MAILKVDEKIVDYFLETRQVGSLHTPNKAVRMYWNGKGRMILILTPMMQESKEKILADIMKTQQSAILPLDLLAEHKRGKYVVYVFRDFILPF